MELRNQLFIDGQWCDSSDGGTFDVINPATGDAITSVQKATKDDIRKAVASARKAFESTWRETDPFERSAVIHKIGDAIAENLDFLAGVETDDVGKPIFESANVDVPGAGATMHYFADIAVDLRGDLIPAPYSEVLNYTIREPIGVVGAIIPWNFPFLIAARKIGSALAAGNTVVIKPATWAPLSTVQFGQLLEQAGLPPGVVNIIPAAGPDVGEVFTEEGSIDEVTFTGSTAIGAQLYENCSHNLKSCTLELGGKSPAVVLPDCDMDETVAGTLFGVYLNQGECCCAATRLIVHGDVYDEFVSKFVAASKAIKIGLPREEDCRMGPLVHPDHLKTVTDYVEWGKKEGAALLCGGNVLTDGELAKGNFMEATVFADVTPAMKIWREEVFGPVVTVTR
ncbi:MAG: aldehyde dehydrogenase, partial [Planctomycetes bacterium]|nr:aldehyde dehydrogenase [Planctomycetota bacterium]